MSFCRGVIYCCRSSDGYTILAHEAKMHITVDYAEEAIQLIKLISHYYGYKVDADVYLAIELTAKENKEEPQNFDDEWENKEVIEKVIRYTGDSERLEELKKKYGASRISTSVN